MVFGTFPGLTNTAEMRNQHAPALPFAPCPVISWSTRRMSKLRNPQHYTLPTSARSTLAQLYIDRSNEFDCVW